jgi:hypothetical protein
MLLAAEKRLLEMLAGVGSPQARDQGRNRI